MNDRRVYLLKTNEYYLRLTTHDMGDEFDMDLREPLDEEEEEEGAVPGVFSDDDAVADSDLDDELDDEDEDETADWGEDLEGDGLDM